MLHPWALPEESNKGGDISNQELAAKTAKGLLVSIFICTNKGLRLEERWEWERKTNV